MLRSHLPVLLALFLLWGSRGVLAEPQDLPPPARWGAMQEDTAGAEIGLPFGATRTYTLGRSLLQRGETEAALLYLNRAFQLAPRAWTIGELFARALAEAGYLHDAVKLYGELVEAEPDSLAQRRQYAVLLAQTNRPRESLQQVLALRDRGQHDVDLIRLQADLLGQLDDLPAALQVYRDAAEQDSGIAEDCYLAAAALLERRRQLEDMADLLREGIERVPTSRRLTFTLLRLLAYEQRFPEAQLEAAAADERLRSAGLTRQPVVSQEYAEFLVQQGRLEPAQEVLASLVEQEPPTQATATLLARIHLARGEADLALPILAQAVDRWSGQADLHHLLARTHEMMGEPSAAREQLLAAIDLQPDNASYRIELLRLLVLRRQADQAVAEAFPDPQDLERELRWHAARAAALLGPSDSHGHLVLGYVFRELADLERACRHFHLAGESNETRLLAWLELSACLQSRGESDEALRVLFDLQAAFPDDPEVANNLGYTLAERGEQLELAEQLVRQALRTDPQNGAYLDSLGWILYQQGDFEGAFQWLVEAVNQLPGDPTILEHLGLTMLRREMPEAALDLLRRALEAGGDAGRLHGLIDEVERGR